MALVVSELARVVKWADQERVLFDLLSFELPPGGSLGLTGPAGAGKSAVLRTIVGLDDKSHGTIQLDGVAAEAMGWPKFRAQVGFAPSSPLSGDESLKSWNIWSRNFRAQATRKVPTLESVAEEFGFPPARFATKARDLPPPLAHLAAIVLHVRMAPRFLLLDEPPPEVVRELRDRLAQGLRSARSRGMGLLLASRDELLLAETTDELVLLYDGNEQARGRTSDIIPGAVAVTRRRDP